MLPDLLFYFFSAGLLTGALSVVTARNPMICVLGMILSFVMSAGLFILLDAEFLGLLLIMVYVGAIAVMFLFVLMTIDIDFDTLREGFAPYLPAGLLVAGAFLALLLNAGSGFTAALLPKTIPLATPAGQGALKALGNILFSTYALPFQAAGLVLLTAMIGAIVLTHRRRGGVRRQNISQQVLRTKSEGLVLTRPPVGAGMNHDPRGTAAHWRPLPASMANTSKADEDED